jgi:hypothetical protein
MSKYLWLIALSLAISGARAGELDQPLSPYTPEQAVVMAKKMLSRYASEMSVSQDLFADPVVEVTKKDIYVTFALRSNPSEDYFVAFGRNGEISESPNLPSLILSRPMRRQ